MELKAGKAYERGAEGSEMVERQMIPNIDPGTRQKTKIQQSSYLRKLTPFGQTTLEFRYYFWTFHTSQPTRYILLSLCKHVPAVKNLSPVVMFETYVILHFFAVLCKIITLNDKVLSSLVNVDDDG